LVLAKLWESVKANFLVKKKNHSQLHRPHHHMASDQKTVPSSAVGETLASNSFWQLRRWPNKAVVSTLEFASTDPAQLVSGLSLQETVPSVKKLVGIDWRHSTQLVLSIQLNERVFESFVSLLGKQATDVHTGLRDIFLEATDDGIILSSEPGLQPRAELDTIEKLVELESTTRPYVEQLLQNLYDWICVDYSPSKVTQLFFASNDRETRCTSLEIIIFVENRVERNDRSGVKPTHSIPTVINVEIHWHFDDRTSPSWKINLHIEPDPFRFIQNRKNSPSIRVEEEINLSSLQTWLSLPYFWKFVSVKEFRLFCKKARDVLSREPEAIHAKRLFPWSSASPLNKKPDVIRGRGKK
jgi:hypothetical protein